MLPQDLSALSQTEKPKSLPNQTQSAAPSAPAPAVVASPASQNSSPGESQKTRYGMLTVSPENVLLLDGKPTTPRIEGNSGLSFIEKFSLGETDVVLVQDVGGSSCPAMFHIVEVNRGNNKASSAFGTCSDVVTQSVEGAKVVVKVSGFAGPFESDSNREKAGQKQAIYTYENGVVTESKEPAQLTSAPISMPAPTVTVSPPAASVTPDRLPSSAPAVSNPAPGSTASVGTSNASWAPSFDCAKASTGSERLICSSRELSEADVRLAQIYRVAASDSSDRETLRNSQNAWRKDERDACIDAACMLAAYRKRIAQLTR